MGEGGRRGKRKKKESCQICALAFPASIMCPPGAMCNYCRRTAEQMRERIVGDSGGSPDDWCLLRFRGVCAAPVDRAPAPPATKYQLPPFFPPPSLSLSLPTEALLSPGPPYIAPQALPPPPTLPSSARFMRKTPLSFSHLAPLPGRAPGLVWGLIFYLGRPLTRTLPL